MISDFGLSKIFNDEEVMKTACGTPGYVGEERGTIMCYLLFRYVGSSILVASSRGTEASGLWERSRSMVPGRHNIHFVSVRFTALLNEGAF